MRLPILLLALLAAAVPAGAQSDRLTSEASVDQETYGYAETITLRYTIRNESAEPTTLWGYCDSPRFTLDSFTSPGEGAGCITMVSETEIPAEGATTWVWVLDPERLGVPDDDGVQTVTVETNGWCGPVWESATPPCPLEATATFEAPRFVGGELRVSYDLAHADTVAVLKRTYNAVVTDSTVRLNTAREVWLIEGTPLLDAVDALRANGVVDEAWDARVVLPERAVAATPDLDGIHLAPPSPNPFTQTTSFTVRLAAAEHVVVDLVDLLGRRVAVLHDGPLAGGVDNDFVLTAGPLATGVYVVRVRGEAIRQSQRVVVAR